MIAALSYLVVMSWRNRLIARFKRLKQPKYLFGAIVGAAYFYLYFFRWMFGFSARGKANPGIFTGIDPVLLELGGASLLFLFVLSAWIFPSQRAALTFSEAEVAFLFPAPISRRALIHFKLLRSQIAIVFTVLFLTLISARSGSWLRIGIHAGGWWLVLSTLNLHFLGASLERTRLLDRGVTNWMRRGIILGLLLVLAGWVFLWARQTMPALTPQDLEGAANISNYLQSLISSGPLRFILAPFQLVVRPYVQTELAAFAVAAGPALLMLMAHYFWVVRTKVAFEEASLEASQKLAEKVAAVRAGNWQAANKKKSPSRAPFRLKPHGSPVVGLVWKNLIGAGSIISARFIIIMLAVALGLSSGFRGGSGQSGWPIVIASVAGILAICSLFFGPQVLRQDFRREIPQMDMLKVLPLPSWQIALGQVLTPVVLLAIVQWLLIIIAVTFGLLIPSPPVAPAMLVAVGFGAAVLMPCLDLVSLIIPNATVLLFPSWFQTGKDAPHGIEATGQRIIFAFGQLLVLIISMLPAGNAFASFFFIFKMFLPLWIVVPAAAIAAVIRLLITAGFGIFLLGKLFAKFDLSNESPA